jgi:hypothetical protein
MEQGWNIKFQSSQHSAGWEGSALWPLQSTEHPPFLLTCLLWKRVGVQAPSNHGAGLCSFADS